MATENGYPAPVQILLVEDNPGDARLARQGLLQCKMAHDLHVVDDGVKAMAFLNREGQYQEATRPQLILLDLNLPRKDGREVLREIKEHEDLKTIPVIILTTSSAERDINRTYALHANSYITKPLDFLQFVDVVKSIENFWFSTAQLPTR
jgi:chemotaxis family two-component system response regulator Rcp1